MRIVVTGGSGFIGTNFHEYVGTYHKDVEIINVDIAPPRVHFTMSEWIKCDILDYQKLASVFEKSKPECVVHFAAETSCEPELTLDDYAVNIQGAENVFKISSKTNSVKTVIHTSTQFVNQVDFPLENFYDYKPHTIYGESKVISEKKILNANYDFQWVIIRPTNIWGKWHLRYPNEFWKVLANGKYIHPKKKNVVRSYGYVENICHQILFFINNINDSKSEVFYVGDEPISLYQWVNEFSLALNNRKVRLVSKEVVYVLAIFGTILKKIKIEFPITLSRYKSMTLSNPAPMKKTMTLIGKPKFDWKEGVKTTSEWLKNDVYD